MAVPFCIPEEKSEENTNSEALRNNSSQQTTTPNRNRPNSIPIPIRIDNSQFPSPLNSPVDGEMLVQVFVEALCRCSQEIPNFHISAPSSPSSPFNQGQFWFPQPSDNFNASSPSTSAFSSPRNSFRMPQLSRRRLNSYGNQSQYSHYSDDSGVTHDNDTTNRNHIEEDEKCPKTKHSSNSKKKPKKSIKSSKITNLVISALQFVIDTLK